VVKTSWGEQKDGEGLKVVMNSDPSWEPAELAAGIIDTLNIVAGEILVDYSSPSMGLPKNIVDAKTRENFKMVSKRLA